MLTQVPREGRTGVRLPGVAALLIVLLLLTGCGGALNGSTNGTGATGELAGQIKDSQTGDPVTGQVTVSAGGESSTTSSGSYQLKGVPTGTQTLEASASGYQSFSQQVVVVEGQVVQDIELDPNGTTVTGTASAPSASVAAAPPSIWHQMVRLFISSAHAASLAGETTLPNAQVQAYNWMTGEKVGEPTTTDGDGNYTLTGVPVGADVLVMITSSSGLRLSSVVSEVSEGQRADVNTVTTLAAEAMGELYGVGVRADQSVFVTLSNEIESSLADTVLGSVDLRPGKGWVSSSGFGSVEGLSDQSIVSKLRKEIVGAAGPLLQAKRIVSDFRSIGPAVISSATPVITRAELAFQQSVTPVMGSLGYKLNTVMMLLSMIEYDRLADGEFEVRSDSLGGVKPMVEGPSGGGAIVPGGYVMTVTPAAAPIKMGDVEVWPLEVAIHSEIDDSVDYSGALEVSVDGDGVITQVRIDGSMTDSQLSGDVPSGAESPVSLSVTLNPTWTADSGVPGGNRLSGFSLTGELVTPAVRMEGTLVETLGQFTVRSRVDDSEESVLFAESFDFNGSLSVTDVATFTDSFSGEFVQGLYSPVPAKITAGGQLTSETSATPASNSGDISVNGSFDVAFPGWASWDFNQGETPGNYLGFQAEFAGDLSVPGRAPVPFAVESERTENQVISLKGLTYTRGDLKLTGTGSIKSSGTVDVEPPIVVQLDLTESQGSTITLTITFDETSVEIDGAIKDASGTTIAEISDDNVMGVKVSYKLADGSTHEESLF